MGANWCVHLLAIELLLLLYPCPKRAEEWSDHVEVIVLDDIVVGGLWGVVPLPYHRQVGEFIPVDLGDFLAGARLEKGVHGHAAKDVQHHILFAHGNSNTLHLVFGSHQISSPQIVARLFVDLAHGAVKVRLVFVDLSTRKTPLCALLPALDQHSVGHVVVQHDGTAHRHACLVGQKLLVGLDVELF